MKIGEKEYSDILVTDLKGNLLASITDNDIIEEKNCKVMCASVENIRTERARKITAFDVIKQLELDVFCDLMFGTVKGISTQNELKEVMQTEISEKALQQINDAALRQRHHPLSFSG